MFFKIFLLVKQNYAQKSTFCYLWSKKFVGGKKMFKNVWV